MHRPFKNNFNNKLNSRTDMISYLLGDLSIRNRNFGIYLYIYRIFNDIIIKIV